MLTIKELDGFCILLKEINMNFDLAALTESRIKQRFPPKKLNWKITERTPRRRSWRSFTLHQQKAILLSNK